jgi:hypothetical protein
MIYTENKTSRYSNISLCVDYRTCASLFSNLSKGLNLVIDKNLDRFSCGLDNNAVIAGLVFSPDIRRLCAEEYR